MWRMGQYDADPLMYDCEMPWQNASKPRVNQGGCIF